MRFVPKEGGEPLCLVDCAILNSRSPVLPFSPSEYKQSFVRFLLYLGDIRL